MVSLQSYTTNTEVLLIGKALLIAIFGVFLGLLAKYVFRKSIDKFILKKIFTKDASTYETSSLINKIFTEVLQWLIIIWFLNYSLTLLHFDFLSNALAYIITNIPKIATFVLIIVAGIFIAKIITSRIKEQEIERRNEISSLVELIILAAFFLTALEFIGVKATALIELFKVILYIIGVLLVILIINPKIFERTSPKNKKSSLKLFSF